MLQIARGTYIGDLGADLLLLRCEFANGATNRPERISGDIFRGLNRQAFNPEFPDTTRFYGSFYSLGPLEEDADRLGFQANGLLLLTSGQNINLRIKVRHAGTVIPGSLNIQLTTTGALTTETFQGDLDYWMAALRTVVYEFDIVGNQSAATMMWGVMQDIVASYQKVGVSLVSNNGQNRIAGGDDSEWDEGELLAAMQANFTHQSTFGEQPAWRTYLLAVPWFRGDTGSGKSFTTGIMFDVSDNHQRQGAAVFWRAREVASGAALFRRDFARTATHELGHVFNLVHPFSDDTSFCDSRSCMNYPKRFPGGENAYWNAYNGAPLCFTDNELDHIYHNRLEVVMMGWHQFQDPRGRSQDVAERLQPANASRLELKLRTRPRRVMFEFGEPVHVEAKLGLKGTQPRSVPDMLNPALGAATYLIEKPNGEVVRFQPSVRRDVESRPCQLDANRRAIYENINLTYGAGGFVFTDPGRYRIQAVLKCQDSVLASKPLVIGVRRPNRQVEEGVIEAWNDELGAYLSLWGVPQRTNKILGQLQKLEKCKCYGHKPHPLYREAMRSSFYVSLKPARIVRKQNDRSRVAVLPAGISQEEQHFLENELLGINEALSQRRPDHQILPNILHANLSLAYARFNPDKAKQLLQGVRSTHEKNNKQKSIADHVHEALKAKFDKIT